MSVDVSQQQRRLRPPAMTSIATAKSPGGRSSKRGHVDVPEDSVVPDSTTEMAEFSAGQDVLLQRKDGRFYFGTVVQVDATREQCLVKFGDNTDSWSSYKDLTKLSQPDKEDLLCVGCKKSEPKCKKEIIVCDKCGRGYHQKCHTPQIPPQHFKDDSAWMCKRCVISESPRLRKSDLKQQRRDLPHALAESSSDNRLLTSQTTKVFPYDLNSLTWDAYHRVNSEHVYCYCGEGGEWYKQMFSCCRCKQWFHESCVECIQYPLYRGDRFYVFVCSICNQGKEFLRRLEMKWVDLVHLMLFNLTVYNSKKYYDLDTIIIPYINDNWHALQLPPKIASVSKSERRDIILSVLTTNRNRFKCGREIKKRTTIWGLRVRLPPPVPNITPTPSGRVTEAHLREMCQGNRRLQFLPQTVATGRIVVMDNHMINLMRGVAYLQSGNPSETDSPCPSPDAVEQEVLVDYTGCAKKTAPVSAKRVDSEDCRGEKRSKRRHTNDGLPTTDRSYTTRLTLDKIITASSINNSNKNESLPLTPPTSVSAPPTPPASGSTSLLSDLSCTPCDTSGDETSSKSTLDLIIPPPKDFEGKNNPFHALLGSFAPKKKSKKHRKNSITLPLPLTAVIPGPGKPVMRPTKRQLSEKDIVIGPNGEVKRRRLRRGRAMIPQYGQPTASKTAAILPVKPGTKADWATESVRKLRQRTDKRMAVRDKDSSSSSSTSNGVGKDKSSPKPSPVKQEPDSINMDDLKTSVNMYFGAANRIAAGERYTVRAQRIGATGKLEFLIEWDGPATGMT